MRDTQQKTAELVGETMYRQDAFAQMLGMVLESIEPGRAVVALTVTDQLLNGHGICHGGVTFSLADTAFAYACNSRNQKTVALSCVVSFTKPGLSGDRLTAVAEELALTGRTGVYDVTVQNASKEVVALFRGTSYAMNDRIV